MRIRLPVALAVLVAAACGGGTDRSGLRATTAAPSTAAPGLTLELTGAAVAEGAAPVVTFRATDGAGAPLDVAAEIAAGRMAPRFVLARRLPDGTMASYLLADVAARPYVDARGATVQPTGSATQAIADPPYGAWPLARLAAKGDGEYAYTFGAPVTGVEPAATHLAGMWATRTTGGLGAPATATLDFVPAGGTPAPREEVVAAACGRCHGTLRHHDERHGPKLCLACHTTQTFDPETGTALDLTTMVHRIHKGARLSRPLVTVGYQQHLHDYGHVAMAPSHSTYLERTVAGTGATGGDPVNDPGIVRNCALCHQGAEGDRWRTAPSARACGSCHDRVDFASGTHAGGVATGSSDAECARCHLQGESSTPPTERVHSEGYETTRNLLFPEDPRSGLAPGTPTHAWAVKIDAVRNAAPGQRPEVDFTLTLDGKPFDGSVLPPAVNGRQGSVASLGFMLAGPVETDYAETWPTATGTTGASLTPSATSTAGAFTPGVLNTAGYTTKVNGITTNIPATIVAIDAAAGKFTYKFSSGNGAATTLPATAKPGTYVLAFESYYRETALDPTNGFVSKPYAATPIFRGEGKNVVHVNMADGTPSAVERRAVVSTDKCNACHEDLGFHSNRSRKGLDYCATCHNPTLSNATRARFRPADTGTVTSDGGAMLQRVYLAESVATKVFIHRIHMGAELPSVKAGGRVVFGANRTTGDATPGSEGLSEFTAFESPRPIADCAACHLDGMWALPDAAGRSPVRRSILDCTATANDATGVAWCSSRAVVGTVTVPPLKAVCTSCHDDPASSAHADLNTVRPNTPDAVEGCGGCHGVGKDLDALRVHAAP